MNDDFRERLVDLEAQCSALRAILGCAVAAIRHDKELEDALGPYLLHARTSFEEIAGSPVADEAAYADRALELFKWIEGTTAA